MIDVLKKLAAVVVVISACTFYGLAVSPSSNTIWNLTNGKGGTNDLVQIDNSGNIKADGSITVKGASTAGSLTLTNVATFSATAGKILVGTNIGANLTLTIDTNKIKIVNGIITAVNVQNL